MPASLYIIKIPAADWQKVTAPGDIVSHGFRAQQSTACRLPDPRYRGGLTQPTTWATQGPATPLPKSQMQDCCS